MSIVGIIYQILGICTVVIGVDDRLKYFRGKSILESIMNLVTEAFPFLRKPITVNISATLPNFSGGGGYLAGIKDLSPLTTEEKIKWIQEEIYNTQKLIRAIEENVKTEFGLVNEKFVNIGRELNHKMLELNKILGLVFTKSFKIEILGLILLIVGVIYAGLPVYTGNLYQKLQICFTN